MERPAERILRTQTHTHTRYVSTSREASTCNTYAQMIDSIKLNLKEINILMHITSRTPSCIPKITSCCALLHSLVDIFLVLRKRWQHLSMIKRLIIHKRVHERT
jgi:hypothetical protein